VASLIEFVVCKWGCSDWQQQPDRDRGVPRISQTADIALCDGFVLGGTLAQDEIGAASKPYHLLIRRLYGLRVLFGRASILSNLKSKLLCIMSYLSIIYPYIL